MKARRMASSREPTTQSTTDRIRPAGVARHSPYEGLVVANVLEDCQKVLAVHHRFAQRATDQSIGRLLVDVCMEVLLRVVSRA